MSALRPGSTDFSSIELVGSSALLLLFPLILRAGGGGGAPGLLPSVDDLRGVGASTPWMLGGRREEAWRAGGGGGAGTLEDLEGVSLAGVLMSVWGMDIDEIEGEGAMPGVCLGAA